MSQRKFKKSFLQKRKEWNQHQMLRDERNIEIRPKRITGKMTPFAKSVID